MIDLRPASDRMTSLVVGLDDDQLVIHAWDLSVATGQAYDPPADEVEATIAFVSQFDAPRDGRLFGPVVDIAPNAPTFERLLGLTGRDPQWRPTA